MITDADGQGSSATSEAKAFTINKAQLTVTASSFTIECGAAPPVYTVTFNGFVNDETHNVLGGALSFACDYVQGGEAKTYAITPSGLTSNNYDITYVAGTLMVKEEPVTPPDPTDPQDPEQPPVDPEQPPVDPEQPPQEPTPQTPTVPSVKEDLGLIIGLSAGVAILLGIIAIITAILLKKKKKHEV